MRDRIRQFMEAGEGEFTALALELYAWQVEHNATYRALSGDVQPTRIEEIPAVPVSLFQSLVFTSFPVEETGVLFRTSGTTGAVRGVHRLRDTELYDLGAWRHFRTCVGPLPTRVASLCPTSADSSLGHMVAHFAAAISGGGLPPLPLFSDTGVAPDGWAQLAAAARSGPVLLAATAFALDALFALPGKASLSAGSLVMVTGGFKGRTARLDPEELYAAIPERLGLPRVVGEYGMTELSSQLWTAPVPPGGVPGPFVAPPWMRVYAADPATGEPTTGEGLLRFIDLCNVDSVLAIETMDLGVVRGQSVMLRGRLAGAEARGCSLRAEDFLSAARRSGVG
jgi:acyl-CoA synthetase (AMP-forming)/AMP-acid ligase II